MNVSRRKRRFSWRALHPNFRNGDCLMRNSDCPCIAGKKKNTYQIWTKIKLLLFQRKHQVQILRFPFRISDYLLSIVSQVVKGMTTHSSTLAWRIPWTEEPGGLQSMGHRVGQDWVTNTHIMSPVYFSFKYKNDVSWELQGLFFGFTFSVIYFSGHF